MTLLIVWINRPVSHDPNRSSVDRNLASRSKPNPDKNDCDTKDITGISLVKMSADRKSIFRQGSLARASPVVGSLSLFDLEMRSLYCRTGRKKRITAVILPSFDVCSARATMARSMPPFSFKMRRTNIVAVKTTSRRPGC